MNQDCIITKNKEEFLVSERNFFPSMTDDEMSELISNCDKCGVLYWMDCKKRCSCE